MGRELVSGPSDAAEHQTMVNDCQARDRRMSEWEREFMSSIEQQLKEGKELSPKQIDVLNRVWEKVTS